MTQNNLYMEDDNMRLYIDVQPLFIDELENSKNSCAFYAQQAAQSAQNAKNWKDNIADYKTNLELFYAQSENGLTNLYNSYISGLYTEKNNILNNFNSVTAAKSTELQNYVNRVREYAEHAENAINNGVSLDHLRNSNCLITGEETNDADVLKDVKTYAHSTFDLSKFTVVGSPVITSDGIASGFSSSNYLQSTQIIDRSKPWVQYVPFRFVSQSPEYQIITREENGQNSAFTRLEIDGNQKKIRFHIFDTNLTLLKSLGGVKVLNLNADYIAKIEFTGTSYKLYLSENGGDFVQDGNTFDSTTTLGNYAIRIGDGNYQWYFSGSIDLKQFSITVDGVPVFSGNQTGIDTIKDVNFSLNTTMYAWVYDTHTIYANGYNTTTVAPTELYDNTGRIITQSASTWQIVVDGDNTYVKYNGNNATYTSGSNITTSTADSPLVNPQLPIEAGAKITSDGIASGFGIRCSNGIDTGFYIPTDKDFEIETEFVLSANDVGGIGQGHFIIGTQYNPAIDRTPVSMYFNASQSGSAVIWKVDVIDSNDTITNLTMSVTVGQRSAGDKIKTTLRRDKTTGKYIATAIVNGEEKTPVSVDSSLDLVWSPRIYIGIQKTNYTVQKFFGSIDLNAFKIYVDGDLVYQPCLKIPFTKSDKKYGSKVVDGIYHSRVQDAYEQGYIERYYVLDEKNDKAWIPKGDIYGMIETLRKLIIDRTS